MTSILQRMIQIAVFLLSLWLMLAMLVLAEKM